MLVEDVEMLCTLLRVWVSLFVFVRWRADVLRLQVSAAGQKYVPLLPPSPKTQLTSILCRWHKSSLLFLPSNDQTDGRTTKQTLPPLCKLSNDTLVPSVGEGGITVLSEMLRIEFRRRGSGVDVGTFFVSLLRLDGHEEEGIMRGER